jgi:hypothetical protein
MCKVFVFNTRPANKATKLIVAPCEGIKRAFKIMKNLSALLSKNLEILAPYLKKKNIVVEVIEQFICE